MITHTGIPLFTTREDGDEPMPSAWTLAWDHNLSTWGLAYRGDMTMMCYGLGYAKPEEIKVAERFKGEGRDRWYFDAGGNGRPIYALHADLCEGFQALGLLT